LFLNELQTGTERKKEEGEMDNKTFDTFQCLSFSKLLFLKIYEFFYSIRVVYYICVQYDSYII
jgi:hypothetical protein